MRIKIDRIKFSDFFDEWEAASNLEINRNKVRTLGRLPTLVISFLSLTRNVKYDYISDFLFVILFE